MARGIQPAQPSTSIARSVPASDSAAPSATYASLVRLLNPRRQLFVEAYLINLNGREAAIRAGFSPKNADLRANALMKVVAVRAAIDAGLAEKRSRFRRTGDEILQELDNIGFSNMADYTKVDPVTGGLIHDFRPVTRAQMAAVAEVTSDVIRVMDGDGGTGSGGGDADSDSDAGDAAASTPVQLVRTKFKLHDKRAALIDLGKHLGLFQPQTSNALQINVGVQVQMESAKEKARQFLRPHTATVTTPATSPSPRQLKDGTR